MIRVRNRLRVKRRKATRRTGRNHHFRQPEIQYFSVPTLGHKDVGRFDVPVDDAFRMSRIERIGNLDRQWQNQLDFRRPARNTVLQG